MSPDAQERPTRSVCLGAFGSAAACCMHLCRGTRARVVADTGDRFFSHFPSSRLRSSLQTLTVLWQCAEGPDFPTTFACPSALAFRSFCCSCLRVPRYVVSLITLLFTAVCASLASLTPYLSRVLSCRRQCLFAHPPHSIELDSRNSFFHFA